MRDTRSLLLFVSPYDIDHERIRVALRGSTWRVRAVYHWHEAWCVLSDEGGAQAILAEAVFPDGSTWRGLFDRTRALRAPPPFILGSELAESRLWAPAIDAGAFDVLLKPFVKEEVLRMIGRIRRGNTATCRALHDASPTVLVAGSPELQAMVSALLERRGYSVLTPSPAKVAGVLQSRKIDLIVTSRPELLAEKNPNRRVLFVTSLPDRLPCRELIPVIREPITPAALVQRIEQVMAKSAAARARH